MTTAALPPRSPNTCLQAITESITQLDAHFGVTVHWRADMAELCDWDGYTRTVTLAADSPLEDQAWVLADAWTLCAVGRHAVPAATTRRHLRAVP